MAKPRYRKALEVTREQIGVFIEGDSDLTGAYQRAYDALGRMLERRAITRSTMRRVQAYFAKEPELSPFARALETYEE